MGDVVVLLTLTASHRDLDLDVLEQLSCGAHTVASQVVADSPSITGCVVLATCNRFELYLDGGADAGAGANGADGADGADGDHDGSGASDAAIRTIARTSGMPVAEVRESLQARIGPEVPRHLFAVASGLESMVVGEREVAGQVKRALHTAQREGTTSPALERLFQQASRTSRAVGSRTGLGGAGRSVVGVALDLAQHTLAESGLALADARVLLIGTGSYAGAAVSALRSRGVQTVAVHSPSGRAEQFAAERALEPVPSGAFGEHLAAADVVVSCSGALGPVVDAAMVETARSRTGRPTVLVDLALHHDIDPAVADLPGVRLIDLAAVQRHSPSTVTPAIAAGLGIVEQRAGEFEAELAEQALIPSVVALRSHVDAAVAAEVERVRARTNPAVADQVERSLRRVAAALLHTPTVRAREHAREGRDQEYQAALDAVFGPDRR